MDEQGRNPSSGEREENTALRRVSAGQSEAIATVHTSVNESAIPGPVPAPVPAPRRRTKTGCLTCRKRRIKCGEEKPRCHNCIKAKRECEGYTAPVVFKHALGPFGAVYDPRVPASLQMPMAMSLPGQVHGRGTLLPQMHNITGPALNPQQRVLAPRLPAASPSVSVSASASAAPFLPHHQLSQQRQHQHQHQHQQQQQHHSQSQPSHYASPFLPAVSQAEYINAPAHSLSPPGVTLTPTSATAQTWHLAGEQAHLPSPLGPETPVLYRHQPGLPEEPYISANTSFSDRQTLMLDSMAMLHPDATGQITPDTIGFYTDDAFQQAQVYYSWDAEQEVRIPTTHIPDDLKDNDYELEDEEEGGEEVDKEEEEEERHVTEEEGYNQLNLILSSAHQDAMRSYNTYLNEPNMLAFYSPSLSSSPLNNPKTARIWVHFMHATGPSISIWERLNTAPTPLYGGPVPASQQGLWGYIMPLLSLKYPALLQSILAMSSLHIARLQQSHYTITFKHYEYALRKVSKAVGLPLPRKQVATLAATLLLAFYEVSAADHTKWDRHVAGAAQLLKEIDFEGMTRDLRAYRRTVNSQKRFWSKPYHVIPPYSYLEDDPYADKESGVDANIVSRLVGTSIDYDMIGSIDIHPRMRKRHFSRKDIENFRLQCDMYWWYLKQDLFQSLVSGNRLHTPFSRWHVCAPRAGLGKSDAIYGSFDHLVLLMGRMMDFGYRDRKRKLKSLDASGRDWHPHPGFFKFMGRFSPKSTTPGEPPSRMGPAPSSGPSQKGQGNEKSMEQGPPTKPMYGMAPTGDPVPPPSAFTSMGESPPYSGYVEDENEVTTLEEAEAEWERILAAYEFYEAQLGEAFAPLPADSTPPISSPFGPAIQFRSHVISVLWVFYYTGRIMLNRLHPCMPPATMMAAFTAAGTTAKFAHMIGRITAGVYYPELYAQEVGNLNPALGGAWTEAALPLFVAGLQYTDATQRDWTIATLRGTAQVTGWQSAEAIATGCESAWVRAATLGRGPAYVQSEESPLAGDYTSKRGGQTDKYIPDSSNYERRFVKVQRHMRAHWAMGLLELEGDLEGLNIDDPPQTPDHR